MRTITFINALDYDATSTYVDGKYAGHDDQFDRIDDIVLNPGEEIVKIVHRKVRGDIGDYEAVYSAMMLPLLRDLEASGILEELT